MSKKQKNEDGIAIKNIAHRIDTPLTIDCYLDEFSEHLSRDIYLKLIKRVLLIINEYTKQNQ